MSESSPLMSSSPSSPASSSSSSEMGYKRLAIFSSAFALISFVALVAQFSSSSLPTASTGIDTSSSVGPSAVLSALHGVQNAAISGTSGKLFLGEKLRDFRGARLFGTHTEDELRTRYGPKASASASLTPSESSNADDNVHCSHWSVVTTISPPTDAVERQAMLRDWCIVVVGDQRGPRQYPLPQANASRVVFLTAAKQEKLAERFPLISLLPWNHFGRKNIGYLFAIAHGAQVVYDFDDDNALLFSNPDYVLPGSGMGNGGNNNNNINKNNKRNGEKSAEKRESNKDRDPAEIVFHVEEPILPANASSFNPYPLLGATETVSWPRGFPLDLIRSSLSLTVPRRRVALSLDSVAVVQYLANHDPDVDAIYRLVQPLPLNFAADRVPLVVPLRRSEDADSIGASGVGVYTPYNAQTTLHRYNALWTLLLPVTVHGRVSDIWRSFFAQRILRDLSLRLIFHPPVVVQYRNAHNYLADFESEQPLYLKSGKLVRQLDQWSSCAPTLPGRVEDMWIMLYERGYIEERDVLLVQAWLQALFAVNYSFPRFSVAKNCRAVNPDRKRMRG